MSLLLLWRDLGKKGYPSQQERKPLLQQTIKLYPLRGYCLLANRKYEGKEWFKFLTDNKINFIIRLSKTAYKADISAGDKVYSALLKRALRGPTVSQWAELDSYHYQCVALCHQDGPRSGVLPPWSCW